MAHLPLDDLLDNPDLGGTVDPGLEATLRRLRAAAEDQDSSQTATYESFTITVTPGGDVLVDVSAPTAFGDWVWAAGDLAHHIGPRSGMVNGSVRTVDEILGTPGGGATNPENAVQAGLSAPAAPALASPAPSAPPIDHVEGVGVSVLFLCAGCGLFHEAMPLGGRCTCGGQVVGREAVRCPGCSRLLLLQQR
jgi:hypothetical protein